MTLLVLVCSNFSKSTPSKIFRYYTKYCSLCSAQLLKSIAAHVALYLSITLGKASMYVLHALFDIISWKFWSL